MFFLFFELSGVTIIDLLVCSLVLQLVTIKLMAVRVSLVELVVLLYVYVYKHRHTNTTVGISVRIMFVYLCWLCMYHNVHV